MRKLKKTIEIIYYGPLIIVMTITLGCCMIFDSFARRVEVVIARVSEWMGKDRS